MVTLNAVVIRKLFKERFISSKSFIPTESPTPIIGPINGEINIAPIITAVEFTFNPNDAIKMANIRIHRLAPLNSTPLRMESMVSNSLSLSFRKSRYSRRKLFMAKMFRLSVFIFYLLKKRLITGICFNGKSCLIIYAINTANNTVRKSKRSTVFSKGIHSPTA